MPEARLYLNGLFMFVVFFNFGPLSLERFSCLLENLVLASETDWVRLQVPTKFLSRVFLKGGPFPVSFFFIFVVCIVRLVGKICQPMEANHGSLVSEATALPTEPQPVPNFWNRQNQTLSYKKNNVTCFFVAFSKFRLEKLIADNEFLKCLHEK